MVHEEEFEAYVKEDDIAVGISIMSINAIKPLWELDITKLLSQLGVHEKAHGFSDGLAIVNVVIAVQIQHEGCICENS